MLIDTHCHVYDEAFDDDREMVVQRAVEAGVSMMLLPAIDKGSDRRLYDVLHSDTTLFRSMAGLHPSSVTKDYEDELECVYERLFHPVSVSDAPIAVGEIGLDFYWDRSYEEEQIDVLRRQILWADKLNLPMALHVRKAHNEFFRLLTDINQCFYRGVMHCFGGSVKEAQKAIDMGFYIGIGGVVTFKNATMADVAATVPLNRIVLETDAPYLAPVPHRGKRNESAYLTDIAMKIAEIRGITFDEVCAVTTENARSLFGL